MFDKQLPHSTALLLKSAPKITELNPASLMDSASTMNQNISIGHLGGGIALTVVHPVDLRWTGNVPVVQIVADLTLFATQFPLSV